jgi:hypothetical protein
VDEHTSSGFTVGGSTVDWPDSWVDPRTTGTGAGDVYITDTVLAGGGSSIDLTACANDLSTCSSSITISGSDSDAQFSDVKTRADGTITITYGNYSTEETPSTYNYINKVDIKYVVCTPNGALTPPSCSAPALVATEEQPVSRLAELTDVNNNTYPVHVERTKDGYTFVFWERCASLSDLPFGGALGHGATCPDADIVGAYSTNEGETWTPINVDKTPGHQIMPWAAYDADRDVISIAYQDCNFPDTKQACRVVYQQIPSGYTATSGLVALTSYSYPEDEANRPFFEPLFGDHIGATAWNGHLWVGYTDTLRLGLYGYGTQPLHEANNNVAAEDY